MACAVNSVDFDVSLWCGFYCLRGLRCVSWYVIAHSGCVCFGVVDCYYGWLRYCWFAGVGLLLVCAMIAGLWLYVVGFMLYGWFVLCGWFDCG